jgi:hypothetical protein
MDPEERLPTEDEINVHGSLDENSAVESFLGKNRHEAERLLGAESTWPMEMLGHMGPVAFRYYLPAAVAVIRGDASVGRSDLVATFLGVLEGLLYDEFLVSKHLAKYCADVCDDMLASWDKFDMWGAYESYLPNCRKLQQTFRRLAQ